MNTGYHDFIQELTFKRRDKLDGYYAIPEEFTNFDPETGLAMFEFDEDGDEVDADEFIFVGDEDEDTCYRMFALMISQSDWSDATVTSEGRDRFSLGREEYLVLTDDEADDLWDKSLTSYIDEALEIPEWIRPYFDEEKWKSDARHDGRGQSLSPYDGEEDYVDTHRDTYFIYRQN